MSSIQEIRDHYQISIGQAKRIREAREVCVTIKYVLKTREQMVDYLIDRLFKEELKKLPDEMKNHEYFNIPDRKDVK